MAFKTKFNNEKGKFNYRFKREIFTDDEVKCLEYKTIVKILLDVIKLPKQ